MTTTKREDVLDGIGDFTPGPWEWEREGRDVTSLNTADGFECVVRHEAAWLPKKKNRLLISRAPALVDEIKELRAFLRKLLGSGAWFHSALEFDVHDGFDGEELYAEGRDLLPHTPETHDGE